MFPYIPLLCSAIPRTFRELSLHTYKLKKKRLKKTPRNVDCRDISKNRTFGRRVNYNRESFKEKIEKFNDPSWKNNFDISSGGGKLEHNR